MTVLHEFGSFIRRKRHLPTDAKLHGREASVRSVCNTVFLNNSILESPETDQKLGRA